ncbi:MAG: LysM peptidoglycan-binding domain-containing protein [Chthoniobacterales bacterium]|nr:LysM peptidoglycan-binding domain-containing protein [Chthoniobacterales bacterium]
MKIPTILIRKKKLSAATARPSRSPGFTGEMDYEQMAEPNMKLSRALLIVLFLHVVAVAGIVAFNTIKTRESAAPETVAPAVAASEASAPPIAASKPSAPNDTAQVPVLPVPKPALKNVEPGKNTVKDSGKIYTVAKHDNPVTIARRLKVSEADLLELNQITDPRKLQINQKLRIPERTTSSKSKPD